MFEEGHPNDCSSPYGLEKIVDVYNRALVVEVAVPKDLRPTRDINRPRVWQDDIHVGTNNMTRSEENQLTVKLCNNFQRRHPVECHWKKNGCFRCGSTNY